MFNVNGMFGGVAAAVNGKGKPSGDDLPHYDPWEDKVIPNQQAEDLAREQARKQSQQLPYPHQRPQPQPPTEQQVSSQRIPQQVVPNPPSPTQQPNTGGVQQNELMQRVLVLISQISAIEKSGALAMQYFENVITGRCRLCFPELFRANAKDAIKHSRSADRLLVMFGGRRFVSPMPDVKELSQLPMDIEEIQVWVIAHKYKLSVMYTQLLNLVAGQNAILEDWARQQIQIESDDCLEWRMMADQIQ